MKPRLKQTLASLLIVSAGLLSAACAPQPVIDVNHAPVVRTDGKVLSMTDMAHAIRLAALRQDWKQVDVIEPGHIVATQTDDDGKWSASVDIIYTTTEFSIHYKDSRGLKYNPANHTIAHHYVSMVNDLDDEIRGMAMIINPGSSN